MQQGQEQQNFDRHAIRQRERPKHRSNQHEDTVHDDHAVTWPDTIDKHAKKRRQQQQRQKLHGGNQANHQRGLAQLPGLPTQRQALNPDTEHRDSIAVEEYAEVITAQRGIMLSFVIWHCRPEFQLLSGTNVGNQPSQQQYGEPRKQ